MYTLQTGKKATVSGKTPPSGANERLGNSTPFGPNLQWNSLALRSRPLQREMTVSRPGDACEREADRIAEQVLRQPVSVEVSHAPSAPIQRKCEACAAGQTPCPKCTEEELIQRQATAASPAAPALASGNLRLVSGSGQTLPPPVQAFFEPRLQADLSGVRFHTGREAADAARALQAKAFTAGQEVFFGNGEYAPETATGRRLLAHELAHVVQNQASSAGTDIARTPLDAGAIKADIEQGATAPPELLSWIQILGEQTGEIAFAAARPTGSGPDPAPVPTDPALPINAYFFPADVQHTNQRALIIGGFHGKEHPGFEVADAMVAELRQGSRLAGSPLAFHTLVVPHLNEGGIQDDLAGLSTGGAGCRTSPVPCYNTRCNRQLVDLNRNFPVPGATAAATDCANTARAPQQPETEGLINLINQFQPHRILSTHAISTAASAGVYADPNTNPAATQLACSMARLITDPDNRRGNRLTNTSCNAVYPGDRPGVVGGGTTLGAYAPNRSIPGQTIPVITLEAPTFSSLNQTGARTVEAFLRPVRGFLTDPAQLAGRVDADLMRDIKALSQPARRLFLTGRMPTSDDLYRRIRERVDAGIAALNALTPPTRITAASQQRAFSQPLPGASPQSKIVFEKFTLTGDKAGGWDTLPDQYFRNGNRAQGVDRAAWLAEDSATRLDIILRFSALPGASRHHWGTEVDFNSTANSDWTPASGTTRAGRLHPLGLWLQANAAQAGFVQTYTAGRTGGHAEEPWHYSYAPIALPLRTLYNEDVRLEEDVADPIMSDWQARATTARITLPADLRSALLGLNLSSYVNTIGPGL